MPMRGKRNESPCFVTPHLRTYVAGMLGLSFDQLAARTNRQFSTRCSTRRRREGHHPRLRRLGRLFPLLGR
jgi:hypothetical protein